jgi:hypothetical protein
MEKSRFEKLIVTQLVKKFLSLLWNRRAHYHIQGWFLDGEELLAPRPTPNLEAHPLSTVRDCLFSISAATIHMWMPLKWHTDHKKSFYIPTSESVCVIQDSSVGIALGYGLVNRGFESRWELRVFLFTTAFRPTQGPTQPPIQCVPGALSLGVERPVREADHSPPSSAQVKNAWNYTSTHPIRLHGVGLS